MAATAVLEALLAEDSCQTEEELSESLEIRLKAMGMIQNQGNRKGFSHCIVTSDEKWVHYDNPKRRKSREMPEHASTSTTKPNIHGARVMLCI